MNSRWPWLIAHFLLLPVAYAVCVSALAEQPSKQPQVRTVTIPVPDLNPDFYSLEPHTAVDPENPKRILLSAIYGGRVGKGKDVRADTRLLAWQSEDGGRLWSKPIAPFGGSERPFLRIGADPVVAFGTGKTCWLSGCDYDWRNPSNPDLPRYSSIKVCLSEDGGKKWKLPITVTELDNDKNGKGIVDKPWLAVDRSEGKRRGTLYVAWSRLDEDRKYWDLRCAALPPGARQFAPSVRLGEAVNFKDGGAWHAVQLAVRSDGTLDAVWRVAPSNRLVHASSKDGAKTFSKPAPIAADETIGTGELPSLTATPDGNLLVAWENQGNVLCSVLVSDRWSVPRPVAGDLSAGVLSHQAVAATADALWVLVYRKEWGTPERVTVVLYRSDAQGKKWEQYRILAAREFSNGEARRFSPGDYVGLAAAKDTIYAAYVLPGEGHEGAKRQLYVSALSMPKER